MNMRKAIPLLVIASMMLTLIPSAFFANAALTPTYTAVAGKKGTTIRVTGAVGDIPAGTSLQIYWDTTVGAWDGTKGLMNSTTGKASGAWEVWFDVPEAVIGSHYVWLVTSSQTLSQVFTVQSTVSPAVSSGLPADRVATSTYGLAGSVAAQYFFSSAAYAAWAFTPVAGGAFFTSDGVSTTYSGTLANHPIKPGSFAGGAFTDAAGVITIVAGGTGTINYITGAWTLTYTLPPAAGAVVLTYNYFATAGNLNVLGAGTTNSLGTFTATLTVPNVAVGAWNIASIDAKGNVADDAPFTIGPIITLNPTATVVGQIITVAGRGFTPTKIIGVGGALTADVQIFRGANWAAALAAGAIHNVKIYNMPAGGVVVDGSGRFTMQIIVPGGVDVSDAYFIQVVDNNPENAHASLELTKLTNVSVSPKFATQGSAITVTGTGFDQVSGTTVTVELWNTALTAKQADIGTATTDSSGVFSKVFSVPSQLENAYKIVAFIGGATPVASYVMNSTGFRIGTMYAQLSVTSGPTGKLVTVTGNGFTVGGNWNATIGNKTLVPTMAVGVGGVNNLINSGAVLVPQLDPGTYTVTILDITSGIELTATYTVTSSTQITVTPSTGPNGFNVSVTGNGFAQTVGPNTVINFVLYNKTATGAYDRSWVINVMTNYVPPAAPVAAVVNASGVIRAYWAVPASATLSKGTYYINATDASAKAFFAQATFTVGDKHIVFNPRKTSFAAGEILSFQMEHSFGNKAPIIDSRIKIYNPNGTLVFNGDQIPAADWVRTGDWYTLPYSAQTASGNQMTLADDAPTGTWTATWTDGNGDSVASASFTVTDTPAGTVDEQIAALAAQITAVTTTVNNLSTTVASVATTATAASNAATAASTAASAAASAAQAASEAANAAGAKADAAKTAAESAAAAANGLTTLVYAAIGASLVAALAAIVALMQISRKIA